METATKSLMASLTDIVPNPAKLKKVWDAWTYEMAMTAWHLSNFILPHIETGRENVAVPSEAAMAQHTSHTQNRPAGSFRVHRFDIPANDLLYSDTMLISKADAESSRQIRIGAIPVSDQSVTWTWNPQVDYALSGNKILPAVTGQVTCAPSTDARAANATVLFGKPVIDTASDAIAADVKKSLCPDGIEPVVTILQSSKGQVCALDQFRQCLTDETSDIDAAVHRSLSSMADGTLNPFGRMATGHSHDSAHRNSGV